MACVEDVTQPSHPDPYSSGTFCDQQSVIKMSSAVIEICRFIHDICYIFRQLCERLSPFYQSSSKVFNSRMLQSLLNCLEEHPEMELAVVARQVGLMECLKHEKIAASAKALETTDAGPGSDTSLLQATKVL